MQINILTVAHQAPLSMDSPGKNTGVGCHAPLGDIPDPGIEPMSPVSPALQADSLPLSQRGSPQINIKEKKNVFYFQAYYP